MKNKFNGTLVKYYKRDDSTGYSYVGIETDEIDVRRNIDGFVYAYGIVPKWEIGTSVVLDGSWEDNYIIKTIRPYTETIESSKKILKDIIAQLKAEDDSFKIGTKGINQILDITGPDILGFTKNERSLNVLIEKLPKINCEKLKKIYNRLVAYNEFYKILEYLIPFGGSVTNCYKLWSLYGALSLKKIKEHPYLIGYTIGLDFYAVDKIGKDLNFDPYNEERIQSLLYSTLNYLIETTGSTYVIQSQFKKYVRSINKQSSFATIEIPNSLIAVAIQNMSGIVVELVKNGSRIYKKSLYKKEKEIMSNLLRLNTHENLEFKEEIEEIEKELKIKYSNIQKEAFQVLKTTGVKIITGGPGTGKTTLINGILIMYQKKFPDKKIKLCAPTGRAAQRMSEVTGMEACTIHRLLEFKPFGNDEMKYKDVDDPIDADLLVLDEMSMVDTEIFSLLLPALKKGIILILVGDENQLQSVGPGNILHDLIQSEKFETYRLKDVFRQKNGSSIIDNAYEILRGGLALKKDKYFEIKECETLNQASECIIDTFYELIEKGELNDTLILTPTNVSEGGTVSLNKIISNEINGESEKFFFYKGIRYNINDRVIFHRNNYEKDYYNGDIGFVKEILANGIVVQNQKNNIRITGENLNDISLAYAISIHKSQGSEAKNILILLPDTYTGLLNRNLLFTAITRAKKFIKIVYVNNSLYESIHNIKANKRNTGLSEKLKGIQYATLFEKK